MSGIPPAAARALVGQVLGVSEWLEIDQVRINEFAAVTGDRQFIHVDPERAARTQFGGTIAHGMLTLSLVGEMLPPDPLVLEDTIIGLNYGFDRVRFLAPVHVGKRIRAVHRLSSFEPRGDRRWLLSAVRRA